nr:hypothetical protein [Tanacetum cinerariifolium]
MRGPDPVSLGPNLSPPRKGMISKPKRSTRSLSSKPTISIGLKNFRNMANRIGKGNKSSEVESDREESRDEGADGDVTSNVFLILRALILGVVACFRDKLDNVVEEEDGGWICFLGGKNSSGRKKCRGLNSGDSGNTGDKVKIVGGIIGSCGGIVPVSENPLLSSRVSPSVSPRILRRGEVLVDGGSKIKSTFSFNNVENSLILVMLMMIFVGLKMRHREILGHFRRMWRAYHLDEVILNDYGLYFLKFKSDEGMQHVLENGPWLVYDIPLEAWNSDGISRISTMIENPIIMDRITTEMCERSYGRASFTRVLVEVEAKVRLSEKMERNNYGKGSSNRGGFDGRRRGGMNGKGLGDQRSRKGKSKVDKSRSSRDSFAVNRMASEKINIDEMVINKKKNRKNGGVENVNVNCRNYKDNAMKGVGSQNMFSALLDEVKIKKRLEWESVKERIDDACKKGLRISIEEKSNWSEDLWDYFKVKMQELVRKENVADLKLKIKNLENHISHSSRMNAKESKTKTEAMVRSVMIEKGLTENQATRKVYEEVYSDDQIGIGNSEDKNDKVAKDISGIVQFLTQDVEWVSNSTDSCKGCRIVMGWDSLVVSAKLLAQIDQAMHLLVTSLLDDNQMDFNVILRSNENSNGLNIKSEDTQDFRACIDCLGIEDINMNGLFYTWIQKIKNPDLGVLKNLIGSWVILSLFICILLAKRIKFMKKHMRDLNRKNGHVFNKVKFLRTELGRVYGCLDKDPSNMSLREEEIIYAYAFKEVALDEEKDDIANIFVSHFSSFLGTQDHVYDVEDVDNLFKKRLDADVALDLIKHVNDKEIKDALFSIDDNKASGPDGYSSNFFKAAWNVVGQDVCSAVKDFFAKGKLLSEINTTLISLIPKVTSPARVTDYRPISYCNVVHKRGLRQGDPISPYLFTLVMDVLNLMIKRQVNIDRRFKYHSGCGKLGITGLCFADVLLLLCYGDLVSASILRRGLDEFSLATSLYPSMSKSEAFFCGLTPEARNEILMAMPFKEASVISNELEDKVICIDKKGRKKNFSVSEAWKAIKTEFPKKDRSVDALFDLVVSTVRYKIKGKPELDGIPGSHQLILNKLELVDS